MRILFCQRAIGPELGRGMDRGTAVPITPGGAQGPKQVRQAGAVRDVGTAGSGANIGTNRVLEDAPLAAARQEQAPRVVASQPLETSFRIESDTNIAAAVQNNDTGNTPGNVNEGNQA